LMFLLRILFLDYLKEYHVKIVHQYFPRMMNNLFVSQLYRTGIVSKGR
jgi:hypothetical protein